MTKPKPKPRSDATHYQLVVDKKGDRYEVVLTLFHQLQWNCDTRISVSNKVTNIMDALTGADKP